MMGQMSTLARGDDLGVTYGLEIDPNWKQWEENIRDISWQPDADYFRVGQPRMARLTPLPGGDLTENDWDA